MPIVSAIAVPHPPIILPQVGRGEEEKLRETSQSYRTAAKELAQHQPETVVVISPHAPLYSEWFHLSGGEKAKGNFARFGAPETAMEIRYDSQMVNTIECEACCLDLPAGINGYDAQLDHGTLIPLVFLQQEYRDFQVVRVGLSGLGYNEHYILGQCIAAASRNKRVAVIASGDLSHKLKEDGPYGFAPQGPLLDSLITRALHDGNFGALMGISPDLAERGAECGLRAFIMMAGTLDGRAVEPRLLSYQDTFGVGYAVATFQPGGPDSARRYLETRRAAAQQESLTRRLQEDSYVSLARKTLESYIIEERPPSLPLSLPKDMIQQRAGVFVSLHKGGALRGCIGTIAPTTESVAAEIMQNAISAATGDPRFPAVKPQEVDLLEIHVDVLGAPEPIHSEQQLDPQRYGVIVSSGTRRGLLLPDLDGVDTVRHQVDIARRKAGIGLGDTMSLERFIVVRHT